MELKLLGLPLKHVVVEFTRLCSPKLPDFPCDFFLSHFCFSGNIFYTVIVMLDKENQHSTYGTVSSQADLPKFMNGNESGTFCY